MWGGGGRGEGGKYAGKVVDIKRMTANSNPDNLILFFVRGRRWEGGRARGIVGLGVETFFSYVTQCFNLLHIALNFQQLTPYGYLVMACTRTALETYQWGVTPKIAKT